MINSFKKVIGYTIKGTCPVLLYILKYIPGIQEVINEKVRRKSFLLMGVLDHFKKQEMCEKANEACPWLLYRVPLHFRAQEMCEKAVENHYPLRFIPDHLKTQEMCERAVEKYSCNLKFVPDHFKTEKMCDNAVPTNLWLLEYVPDWVVTQEQLKLWHDYDGMMEW